MADKQVAPQAHEEQMQPGSIREAQEVLLGLMESEEEKPETEEAAPTEEEESTEETQDESLEEEPEEEESEEDDDHEGTEEREVEGQDLYAVTIDGEEHQIPLDELLKGYSRQSDYTRKTQQVSEQRKEFDAMKQNMAQEYQQIQAERNQYVQSLQNLMETSMGNVDKFANIDWETMKETDPIEYVTKREEFREAQEKVQGMRNEQQMAQQRQASQEQTSRQELLQREHNALVDALPDWGNPDKQKGLAKGIRDYAMGQGFAKEELDSLVDHRSILVLLKARQYDQLQKADVKSKKLKNKPRVIRAGTGRDRDADSKSKRTAKMKRLRGSGHVDDAASILEDLYNS
jgi:hypothetical protein